MANQGKGVTIAVFILVGFCAMTCATGVGAGLFFFLAAEPDFPPHHDAPPAAKAVEAVTEGGSEEPGGGLEPVFGDAKLQEELEMLANAKEVKLKPDAERFDGMTTMQLLEVMAMIRVVEASDYEDRKPLKGGGEVSFGYSLPGEDEPLWSRGAGEDIYSGVGALTYLVSDVFDDVYQSWTRPAACAPSWGEGTGWDYFDDTCQSFVYNELFKKKYGVDLYAGVGRLDPAGVKVLLKELRGLKREAPMLGTTASKVYGVVGPAVKDYLMMWESIHEKKGREELLMKRYRDALAKRGMVRSEDGRRDMISLYYDLDEELHLGVGLRQPDYSHTILGFWLRRINDGTARELADFLKEVDGELGVQE